jgi:predicted patatin/cPLA2 family phospholipase
LRHLGISGGATKIAGLYGSCVALNKISYSPDIISGVSAGSILSLPVALNRLEPLHNAILNLTLDDFFTIKPVNENGKISLHGAFRLLTGKPSLGLLKKLISLLSKYVTEKDFNDYIKGDYPEVYIGTVDFKTGGRKYFNVKEISNYNKYLHVVLASSSIPVFCEPVYMDGMVLYDGGVRDHIATPWILENIEGISRTLSLYSRPSNFKLVNEEWEPTNVLSVALRYSNIVNIEISKSDEMLEDLLAEKKSIKQVKCFLPSIMDHFYDVNPTKLRELYFKGFNEIVSKTNEIMI